MKTRSDATTNRLRDLRVRASLTQQDVAERVGVDTGTVSRWERGLIHPHAGQRRRLADALGVTVDDLGLQPAVPTQTPPPLAFLEEPRPVPADARVTRSQTEWVATRRGLNAHRNALARTAADLYPGAGIDTTGAITTAGWIPDRPVPLDRIRLAHDPGAPLPKIDGAEPESANVRPLQTLTAAFPRYSQALKTLAPPRLLENRASWRLAGVDWETGTLEFADTAFFASVDVNEALSHELALVALDEAGRPSPRRAHLRDLPFRRLVGDPFDLGRRPVIPAISTLTLRAGPEPSFLLHRRDSGAVAMAGGACQLVPSGVFQPSSVLPAVAAGDFSLWRCFQREFSEELLGMAEFDGDGQPVDYALEPFASLDAARAGGRLKIWCLGVALDGLTLFGEILTVAVLEPALFDQYATNFVEVNPEGTIVDQRVPFSESAIGQLLGSGRMAPAGGACLTLAWRHRDVLLP